MRKNALLLIPAAALAVALILRARPAAVVVGQPAPAFRLASTAGSTVSLSDYRGKTVLVTFWASWCDSCKEEFPALEAVYQKHRKDGFEIVAPSVDVDGRKAVMPFLAKFSPTFTILLADPKTAESYGVRALPTAFLVGAEGNVVKRYLGPVEPQELENDILSELNRRRS